MKWLGLAIRKSARRGQTPLPWASETSSASASSFIPSAAFGCLRRRRPCWRLVFEGTRAAPAPTDYKEYCEYLFSLKGMEIELPHLIDAVTTNTTDFFREPKHFDVLFENVLPTWREVHGSSRGFMLWSAGCSTGEEPYTLAMVLSEFAECSPVSSSRFLPRTYRIRSWKKPSRPFILKSAWETVPATLKRKYLLRSKDRSKRLVRVVPELRSMVRFRRLNFMENFGFQESMDVIFCRNVMIYFDRPTQERLLSRFCEHLESGGHVFVGHSESLTGMVLPLVRSPLPSAART